MTFILGLTGSIGMGKSTTADMFRDLGIPVWDADETVHRLYDRNGAAVGPVAALIPESLVDGKIDRSALKAVLKTDPNLLNRLETVVHPLVAHDRKAFIAANAGADLIVLDIPLLFETGGDAHVTGTLVVTTDPEIQARRVMDRPGVTAAVFQDLLARQMPDAEKRRRADFIIRTDTIDRTKADVADLVAKLREKKDA